MASIRKRGKSYSVVYNYIDDKGKRRQKWETYKSMAQARERKKEVDYKTSIGTMVVPKCKYRKELLDEYVSLYGKDKWALSTYNHQVALINNYIKPIIGDNKFQDINTHMLEKYYQQLLKTPSKDNPCTHNKKNEFVSTSTIREIHKLLNSCFRQAVKWEMCEKNPAENVVTPKYKAKKREIWDAPTLTHALDVCDNDILKLAINISFAGSLRIGELLALTWDCVDISDEAIAENRACITINKELQRVSKDALDSLDGKDVLTVFPEQKKSCTTIRVLKSPKTESSIRTVYLPRSVAEMLIEHRKKQEEEKEFMGDEYQDYGLVLATSFGTPCSKNYIRNKLDKLIKDNDLPPVVFHSLRHTSITYKLQLNGGDIKAVQGDSGHAQAKMVTDIYGHIIDGNRRRNAELIEDAFYEGKNLTPELKSPMDSAGTVQLPEGVDPSLLMKVLTNPELSALLKSMVKSVESGNKSE